jgi:hypothetical protein
MTKPDRSYSSLLKCGAIGDLGPSPKNPSKTGCLQALRVAPAWGRWPQNSLFLAPGGEFTDNSHVRRGACLDFSSVFV